MVKQFLEANNQRKLKIAVIGDTMIDDYKYGHVERVSPEFPVPILHTRRDCLEQYPGGAANVCYQMKHFNVDAYLIGLVDKPALWLYEKYEFCSEYCVNLNNGRVPIKTRFYDGDFPLLRWDIEDDNYGEDEINILRNEILANFKNLTFGIDLDAVILSDYNKGLWTEELAQSLIKICNDKNIPTFVDPKKNLAQWRGCTVVKPNAAEAKVLTGKNDWQEQSQEIKNILGCQGVVVTQGGQGVVGLQDKFFSQLNKAKLSSKEINSVIGAGDCFITFLAMTHAHGIPLEEGCKIAFQAGVEYVKAKHNQPITPNALLSKFDPVASKIVSLEELLYLKKNVYQDEEWVLSNGCFDYGVNNNHLQTLIFAKDKGNKLIVGLNSDESIARLKGTGRPVRTFENRAALLAGLACVDFVVPFDEDTPLELIKRLEPSCVVKGGDYKPEDVVGYGIVKDVFIAPMLHGQSTTMALKGMASQILEQYGSDVKKLTSSLNQILEMSTPKSNMESIWTQAIEKIKTDMAMPKFESVWSQVFEKMPKVNDGFSQASQTLPKIGVQVLSKINES